MRDSPGGPPTRQLHFRQGGHIRLNVYQVPEAEIRTILPSITFSALPPRSRRSASGRAYGNWSKVALKGWAEMMHRYAIDPQQQFDVTKDESATRRSHLEQKTNEDYGQY